MLLTEVPIHRPVRVVDVRDAGPVTTRLMEMGLINGAELEVVGRAPFGGAMQVRLLDYDLAVRDGEAALVTVTAA